MTWAQTMTIVAPILAAVVAGIFFSNRQFDQICRRLDDLRADINARFASVDARFASVDARFASVDAGFAQVHQDIHELRSLVLDALRHRAS